MTPMLPMAPASPEPVAKLALDRDRLLIECDATLAIRRKRNGARHVRTALPRLHWRSWSFLRTDRALRSRVFGLRVVAQPDHVVREIIDSQHAGRYEGQRRPGEHRFDPAALALARNTREPGQNLERGSSVNAVPIPVRCASSQANAARRLSMSASSRSFQDVSRPLVVGERQGARRERGEVRGVPFGDRLRLAARVQLLQPRTRGSSPACRSARPSGCSICRTRLWSTSALSPAEYIRGSCRRPPRPPPASSRQRTPPVAGTGAARPLAAGRSSRRSWRASSAAGRRASRGPPVSSGSRCSSRSSSACGVSSLIRAAASSIASGRPSSRAQMPATAEAFSVVSVKPAFAALARSTNNWIASISLQLLQRRQCLRIGEWQRREQHELFPGQVQARATGDQHRQVGAAGEQVADQRRRPAESARSCPGPAGSRASPMAARRSLRPAAVPRVLDAESLRDRRRHQVGIADRLQRARSTRRRRMIRQRPQRRRSPARVLPMPPGPVRVTSRTSRAAAVRSPRRSPAPGRRAGSAGGGVWQGGRSATRMT